MILAGDIGGTSTRLALFDAVGGRVAPLAIAVWIGWGGAEAHASAKVG